MAPPKRILVLCTGNRCRSQIMHGWLSYLSAGGLDVFSAGTVPKGVHPTSIEVMAEVGIDISDHSSNHVSEYVSDDFDAVITVCDEAKQACPVFPGAKRLIHRQFEDPDDPDVDPEDSWAVFRRIRDEIGVWSEGFISGLSVSE